MRAPKRIGRECRGLRDTGTAAKERGITNVEDRRSNQGQKSDSEDTGPPGVKRYEIQMLKACGYLASASSLSVRGRLPFYLKLPPVDLLEALKLVQSVPYSGVAPRH